MTTDTQTSRQQTRMLQQISRPMLRFLRLRCLSRANLAATFEQPSPLPGQQASPAHRTARGDC